MRSVASTVARGYGARHVSLRKRWAKRVNAGGVQCARCGLLIVPGSEWDLGHDDHDRSRYVGPEHAACNRGARRRRARPRRFKSGRW